MVILLADRMRIWHSRDAMTETQLRVLVAVAEAGGFSVAAERLAMSQPGVSRAIAGLEAELGTALLLRTRSRVALTAAGERIVANAREVLARTEAIRQEAASAQGREAGRVRVGSLASVSEQLMPGILGSLRERHPELEVALFEGTDDEVIQWTRDRGVDVGVVAGPVSGLEVRPFFEDEMLAALPASHPLAATDGPISPTELTDQPFVMTRAGCERMIFDAFSAAHVAPQVAFEVTETATLLAMVAEGLGVSIVAALGARRPPADVVLRPLVPRVPRRLGLAQLSPGSAPPGVKAFVEHACAWAAAQDHPVSAAL
jgi:DNA-binding transcriptional LysR family regulator